MARRSRIILPGEAHHVTQRGNRRQNVFFCEADYHNYLRLLQTNAELFKFDIWSYCLMPNHVHLLVVPSCEKSFRDGIALLHQTYTRLVNESRSWKGHLWQGRFYSCPVGPCGVPAVARYIELNPVRAQLCDKAYDYSWSSAKESCAGQRGENGFAPIFAPGGTWADYLAYDPLVDTTENLKSIKESVRTGLPFASEQYLEILEKRTGKILKPQKRGRKPIRPSNEIGRVAPI